MPKADASISIPKADASVKYKEGANSKRVPCIAKENAGSIAVVHHISAGAKVVI